MYRSAAKRFLLSPSLLPINARPQTSHIRTFLIPNALRFSSTSAASSSQSLSDHNPNFPPHSQNPNSSDSASSSSSFTGEEARRHESKTSRESKPGFDYEEETDRILSASLRHVLRLGWTESAMIAGAREVGVSPSIVDRWLPRKEASLVQFFKDECLQRLIDRIRIDSEELRDLIPSERISKLVRIRLEMEAPYISKWPQALSIEVQPQNFPRSYTQRVRLVEEIGYGALDVATDFDYNVKHDVREAICRQRNILGAIYSTTEVYMLTDSSPDFCDTWAFMDGQVKDSLDLKKFLQEVKYLPETIRARNRGRSSLQGCMKRLFRR